MAHLTGKRNNYSIITAKDESDNLVRIKDAKKGKTYSGATPDHRDCEFRPVQGGEKQWHFRHLGQNRCIPRRSGESAQHYNTKSAWANFFRDQISGCLHCASWGRSQCVQKRWGLDFHCCKLEGETRAATYGRIVWVCKDCNGFHPYNAGEFLTTDVTVDCERYITLAGQRFKSDMVLLVNDEPWMIFEFRWRHSSEKAKWEAASSAGIPMFEVEIGTAAPLDMGEKYVWDTLPNMSEEHKILTETLENKQIEFIKSGIVPEAIRRVFPNAAVPNPEYILSSSCEPKIDELGRFKGWVFRYGGEGKCSPVPKPRLGTYLYASKTNLRLKATNERFEPIYDTEDLPCLLANQE